MSELMFFIKDKEKEIELRINIQDIMIGSATIGNILDKKEVVRDEIAEEIKICNTMMHNIQNYKMKLFHSYFFIP